ncbi:7142_t:CDS:2 [Paraglomus occultum]|uniref:7142_t:CDS:1 n=1 Tax=Paraglomus occultum TaxID=144539 RepID=A0A9N9FVX8_9GLOM|nr:7142_t:CDS:2 [Paraglomus occultum]
MINTKTLTYFPEPVPSITFDDIEDDMKTSSLASSNQSTSSLFDPLDAAKTMENIFEEFLEIDGRRFMNDSTLKCCMPSDSKEAERLYGLHCVYRMLWGNNFSSPLEEELSLGAKVLDVGCGSGSWVLNMASSYPLSTFVGIDIAPLFYGDCPVNTAFFQCNVFDGLPFPDNTFDFVRQGFLIVCIDWETWKDKVVKELIRVTKPGGYIEIMDVDYPFFQPGNIAQKFNNCVIHFSDAGINTNSSENISKVFSGHRNVTIVKQEEKILYYDSRIGTISLKYEMKGFESMKIFMMPLLGITDDEFSQLLVDLAKELRICKSTRHFYRLIVKKKSRF